MTVFQPDILGLLGHQLDKGFLAAGESFRENYASIVAGLNDNALQQIIYRDAAADRHEHLRALEAPSTLADRKLVGECGTTLLQYAEDDIGRHNLAHRGRWYAFVGAL